MKNRYKGILFILLSAFFFSLMNVLIRMAGDLPTMQKVLFRNLIAAAVSWGILIRKREPIRIDRSQLSDLILRSAFGLAGMICNFYAIDHLNISDASMLNKLSPFFAILMSIFLLKETVAGYEWLSVIVAFTGALFVLKPGFNMDIFPAFLGVLGGAGAGIAYTFMRRAGLKGVKGPVTVMFFSTFSTLFIIPVYIMVHEPMNISQFLCLIGTGCAAAGGQLCITAAYTYAPAKEIAVYDYTLVIYAALWGFLFFGQIPDRFSVIGYIVIISAAVYRSVAGNHIQAHSLK